MSASFSNDSADFVVVGGGTSGLVLANRLSENPDVSVLVLEAGQNHLEDPRVNIPAFWSGLIGTDLDWQFRSQAQRGLGERVISMPQGKLLGGTSGLNAQALVAPSKAGIDAWAALGNPGWDFESLRPYYRKFYTLNLPDEETKQHLGISWIDKNVSGESGPIQASFVGELQNPLSKAWVETFRDLGLETTADPFTGISTGAYSNMSTVDPKTKTRSYAASAYAAPALNRPNLRIVFGAEASRLVLHKDGEEVQVQAVEAIVDGQKQTYSAKKEVILAAGALQTPKLLELSGIGGSNLLSKHGIETIIDNPNVGENLQDHLMTAISFEVTDEINTADSLLRQEPQALQAAMELYQARKAGPFCVGGISSHAYLPILELVDPAGKQTQADILAKFPVSSTAEDKAEKAHGEAVRKVIESGDDGSGALFLFQAQGTTHENEPTKDHGPNYLPGKFASIGCIQTHPLSKGSTHISSADAVAKPNIDPAYFSHPLDLELMARHVLACQKLRNSAPLSSYFKPDGRRNHEKAYLENLEDAKQYAVDTAKTAYHFCGTAGMRPRELGGVVDSDLRVWGTRNLRVVDASVFPLVSRGNTQSTVYAVAEKAADLIKSQA